MKAAIINCGMGNLSSVFKGLEKAGFTPEITSDPEKVLIADCIILPGVGAFGKAAANLRKSNMTSVIKTAAASGKPMLGICLGFQLMFSFSEEAPGVPGLDLIPGEVKRFGSDLKVPQVGWNSLKPTGKDKHPLWDDIPEGSYFYFVHSYYVYLTERKYLLAEADYGVSFCAAAGKGNLLGLQFHPEKSSTLGLRILENFAGFIRRYC